MPGPTQSCGLFGQTLHKVADCLAIHKIEMFYDSGNVMRMNCCLFYVQWSWSVPPSEHVYN